jgi:integrase/recombinase XerD
MNYLPHITNFLEKLTAEDGLSLNTTLSYGKDLELFAKFLSEQKTAFEETNEQTLKDYLYQLHQQNLRSASIARKISALKNFYKFLESENLIKTNPALCLSAPKPDAKLPKFLSEDEVFKMLNFINADKSEFGIKLSCMMEILYAAGLRVSELVSIPISAIVKIENEKGEKTLRNYLIIKGKGNKERIAPLNKSAIKMLLEYLDLRQKLGQEKSKWLFVGVARASKKLKLPENFTENLDFNKNKKNIADATIHLARSNSKLTQIRRKSNLIFAIKDTHITRQRLHQMLKELAIKVGIDQTKVHPHVIRHSFASHLLNSGVDLRVLQELLGHANISTTEIYTHILDSKLQDLVFNHHPLARKF